MPQVKRPKARNNGDPPLKHFPMDFFDGAATDSKGGVGVCIWINEHHYIEMKLGSGLSTNTRAELLALWALLSIAKDIGFSYLHIFGDSFVIINWAKEESTLAIVNLEAWCNNTKKLFSSFTSMDFSHVYREYNMRVDSLSKDRLLMAPGHITFMEFCKGDIYGEVNLQLF